MDNSMVVAWRTNHIILAHICCAKVMQITARPGAIVPASVREPVSHTTPTCIAAAVLLVSCRWDECHG